MPGPGDAHVELLPVHQLPAVPGVHHHQGAVFGPALAGVAGDGIGVVHRLHPAEVQLHAAPGAFQFHSGAASLPVQGPDDARVAVGDAEPLPLDPAAFRLLGLPVLDPVADGEAPVLDSGDFRPVEPGRQEFHRSASLQFHPDRLPLRIHRSDGPHRSLADPIDPGSPLEGQTVRNLVALDLLLLGLGQPV